MSLVTVFCLRDGGVLFASDRREVIRYGEGDVLVKYTDALKLHKYSGGVMGAAGDPGLALDMINLLTPVSNNEDVRFEIQEQLIAHYNRLTKHMPDEARKLKVAEFVFCRGGEHVIKFKSLEGFSPATNYKWDAIGLPMQAALVEQLYKTNRLPNLAEAQRLAALQIHVTHDADPTAVSGEMDMWLLRQGADQPEELSNVDELRAWVPEFLQATIGEFYGMPLSGPRDGQ
jgi:hypothetical protein